MENNTEAKALQDDIEIAAQEHLKNTRGLRSKINTAREIIKYISFKAGYRKAVYKLKSTWVQCKYGDDISNGDYFFLLETNGLVKEDFVRVSTGKVSHYFATHYCKINLPEPPRKQETNG